MRIRILVGIIGAVLVGTLGHITAQEMTYAWIGCDGKLVARTEAGKLQVFPIAKNQPGCVGPRAAEDTTIGAVLSGSTGSTSFGGNTGITSSYDATTQGPLLDLAQTDIVSYRTQLLKDQQIRYANALRSLRMRHSASMQSKTDAYLMRNDAVVVSGSGNGWSTVQGARVSVTDTRENTVSSDTIGKADGYIATRLLRDPNPSDLVRIEQADQQFWSDIARVNVARSVNVRAHPWYGAKILFVLTNATPVYVVSTVDNWSEIINDDLTLHGFIRSDFLTIEKKQRVEIEPLLR